MKKDDSGLPENLCGVEPARTVFCVVIIAHFLIYCSGMLKEKAGHLKHIKTYSGSFETKIVNNAADPSQLSSRGHQSDEIMHYLQ